MNVSATSVVTRDSSFSFLSLAPAGMISTDAVYIINIALPIVFAIATIVGVGLTARHVRNVAKSAVYAHEDSEIRLLCKIINFSVFLGLGMFF